MSIRFQIMVLAFIRDWYHAQAVNDIGELREFFNKRADAYQQYIDELVAGANVGDE